MGKLCGLCGNFDGKTDNEFLSEDGKLAWGCVAQVPQWSAPHADLCPMSPDKLLEPYKYAVLQKLDDPNEICAHEPIPRPTTLKTSRYVCEVAQNSGSEHGWHGGGV